jgi:hypothetical protein
MAYIRDRDAEFAARGPMPKQELLAIFDDMVANADRVLAELNPARLGDPSTDPERLTYLADDLINILTHLSLHTGQIVWIAKMLNEGALDQVWMRTHKHLGGWKRR